MRAARHGRSISPDELALHLVADANASPARDAARQVDADQSGASRRRNAGRHDPRRRRSRPWSCEQPVERLRRGGADRIGRDTRAASMRSERARAGPRSPAPWVATTMPSRDRRRARRHRPLVAVDGDDAEPARADGREAGVGAQRRDRRCRPAAASRIVRARRPSSTRGRRWSRRGTARAPRGSARVTLAANAARPLPWPHRLVAARAVTVSRQRRSLIVPTEPSIEHGGRQCASILPRADAGRACTCRTTRRRRSGTRGAPARGSTCARRRRRRLRGPTPAPTARSSSNASGRVQQARRQDPGEWPADEHAAQLADRQTPAETARRSSRTGTPSSTS